MWGWTERWKLVLKCPGLGTDSWALHLGGVERVCSAFGTWHRFGGVVALHTGKATAPEQQGPVLCFLRIRLVLRSAEQHCEPFPDEQNGPLWLY